LKQNYLDRITSYTVKLEKNAKLAKSELEEIEEEEKKVLIRGLKIKSGFYKTFVFTD
jgi:hypothetical protein